MIANIEGFDESHEWLPRRLRNPSKATEIHWKVKGTHRKQRHSWGSTKNSSKTAGVLGKAQGTHRKQQESLGKLKESQLKKMDFLESTRNPG